MHGTDTPRTSREQSTLASLSRREFLSGAVAVLGATSIRLSIWAQTSASIAGGSWAGHLLLGVDYYPDQTPEHLWDEDSGMMAEIGLTNVRVAEFAWALMEPAEGKFDFAWLHRAVKTLHKDDISVILSTPSAAPPPWLIARYPEVVEVNAQGVRLHPGGRRFTCPTNPVYRRLSLSIASEMARVFAETPGVIGWQIDNELTLGSSPAATAISVRSAFRRGCALSMATWKI